VETSPFFTTACGEWGDTLAGRAVWTAGMLVWGPCPRKALRQPSQEDRSADVRCSTAVGICLRGWGAGAARACSGSLEMGLASLRAVWAYGSWLRLLGSSGGQMPTNNNRAGFVGGAFCFPQCRSDVYMQYIF